MLPPQIEFDSKNAIIRIFTESNTFFTYYFFTQSNWAENLMSALQFTASDMFTRIYNRNVNLTDASQSSNQFTNAYNENTKNATEF